MKLETSGLVENIKKHPVISAGLLLLWMGCVLPMCVYPFIPAEEMERIEAEEEAKRQAEEAEKEAEAAAERAKEEAAKEAAEREAKEAAERKAQRKKDDQAIYAWSTCQRAVKDQLKAPSTAEFAPIYKVEGGPTGKGYWVVAGYVDSENSFGAKIRMDAVCKLKPVGDAKFEVLKAGLTSN